MSADSSAAVLYPPVAVMDARSIIELCRAYAASQPNIPYDRTQSNGTKNDALSLLDKLTSQKQLVITRVSLENILARETGRNGLAKEASGLRTINTDKDTLKYNASKIFAHYLDELNVKCCDEDGRKNIRIYRNIPDFLHAESLIDATPGLVVVDTGNSGPYTENGHYPTKNKPQNEEIALDRLFHNIHQSYQHLNPKFPLITEHDRWIGHQDWAEMTLTATVREMASAILSKSQKRAVYHGTYKNYCEGIETDHFQVSQPARIRPTHMEHIKHWRNKSEAVCNDIPKPVIKTPVFNNRRRITVAENQEFIIFINKSDHPPPHIHICTQPKPNERMRYARFLLVDDTIDGRYAAEYPYLSEQSRTSMWRDADPDAYVSYPEANYDTTKYSFTPSERERAKTFINDNINECINAWNLHFQHHVSRDNSRSHMNYATSKTLDHAIFSAPVTSYIAL